MSTAIGGIAAPPVEAEAVAGSNLSSRIFQNQRSLELRWFFV
jgi:hypothetical protein